MPRALQHAEVATPWADRLAILVGHDPRELMEMRQVVRGPRCEKLRECDDAKRGMSSSALEVRRLQVQGAQVVEVGGPEAGELLEPAVQGVRGRASGAVEGVEGNALPPPQDPPPPRHPVSHLPGKKV